MTDRGSAQKRLSSRSCALAVPKRPAMKQAPTIVAVGNDATSVEAKASLASY